MDARTTDGRPVIYTIGHSNLPVQEFIAALTGNGVRVLVDVRSTPYSQFVPQFNRENLRRSLAEAGIGYRFAGESLGGRPTDPTCYRNGVVPEGHANYLQHVDYDEVARRSWFQAGLARLLELAGQEPTAIMCSEEDPARCHRYHLITQAVGDAARVLDIRTAGDGGYRVTEATRKARQMTLM
jgi:uncharacterized protein (DUF488 family)